MQNRASFLARLTDCTECFPNRSEPNQITDLRWLNAYRPTVTAVRRLVPLILLVTACTAPATDAMEPTTPDPVTSTTLTSDGSETGATSEVDTTTTTSSGRPVAPDFTLELGSGGEYTLSEGSKPVYMVFWAEW